MNSRIKEVRELNKLNKSEFAKSIGVSPSAIGYIESGEKQPSLETIVKICECFSVDANWLILGMKKENDLTKGINHDGLKELNKYIEYLKIMYPEREKEYEKAGNL